MRGMPIRFANPERPSFVALEVHDCLGMFLDPTLPRVTVAEARNIAARMFGHARWHGLMQAVSESEASPYDEDCEESEVLDRKTIQIEALTVPGIHPEEASIIVGVLTPTAREAGWASLMSVSPSKAGQNVNLGKHPICGHAPLDLKADCRCPMLVIYKRTRIYATTFYADPPEAERMPKLKLRLNHFIQIQRPPQGDRPQA